MAEKISASSNKISPLVARNFSERLKNVPNTSEKRNTRLEKESCSSKVAGTELGLTISATLKTTRLLCNFEVAR